MKANTILHRMFKHKNINQVNQEREKVEVAAKGFESMFTKFLYNKLNVNNGQTDITGKVSNARKIFKNMLSDEFAQLASQRGGVGIKETILNSFGYEPERQGSIIGKYFKHPVVGKVSSDFGERAHPVTGKINYHYGVDIVPDPNVKGSDLIKSPLPGKVIYSGDYGSYGNVILLLHPGGYKTIYAHNHENFVKFGDNIDKGQVIGKVGSTGVSTGKHLHFELRKDTTPIDPSTIM